MGMNIFRRERKNDARCEQNGSSSWTDVNIHVVRFDTSLTVKIYCCCLTSNVKTKMKRENNIWCFSEDVKNAKRGWIWDKDANAANGKTTSCVSFLLWKLEPTQMPDFAREFSRRPAGGDGSAWLRRRRLTFIFFDLRHKSWAPDLLVFVFSIIAPPRSNPPTPTRTLYVSSVVSGGSGVSREDVFGVVMHKSATNVCCLLT